MCRPQPTVTGTAIILVFFILTLTASLAAQTQTVGLLQYDAETSYEGYTLLYPQKPGTVYLLDNYGRTVHTWDLEYQPSSAVYLLPDGDIMRGAKAPDSSGSIGRVIQRIAWDGTVEWAYPASDHGFRQHHDIHPMPNGNVLLLLRDSHTDTEAFEAGRDPSLLQGAELRPDAIIEVEPTGPTTGTVVWEWRVWDHLIQDFDPSKDNYGVVEDHPELIDMNYVIDPSDDWTHANSVSYNAELDQIVISARHFHEIWVIDHSTTTAEAAGHTGGNGGKGGDLLYRWGNPAAYRAGDSTDQILWGQHDAHWIADGTPGAGHLMAFNNGWQHPVGDFSTVVEVNTPVDAQGDYPDLHGDAHAPDSAFWSFIADPPQSFLSLTISGAQRLPNGNTIICEGRTGRLFEVTYDGHIVWEYQNSVGAGGPLNQGETPLFGTVSVFRCRRYSSDYEGLNGRELIPTTPVEGYTIEVSGTVNDPLKPVAVNSVTVSAKVWSDEGLSNVTLMVDTGDGFVDMPMVDDGAHDDHAAGDSVFAAVLSPMAAGTEVRYYVRAENGVGDLVSDPVYADDNNVYYSFSVADGFACGDVDGSGFGPDIADLVYLVNYMFNSGPPPIDMNTADVDGSGAGPDIADLVHLVNYMFLSGPGLQCL